jgi:HK97 family phage major capsid protein/HK97 family phage prohead protease
MPASGTGVLNRAYSVLTIRSVDAERRIITGIATSPAPDRMSDVVEPTGAQFQLPIPLLWQHNSREPIGEVFSATVSPDGIEIEARIATITEPGKLKDRLDEAWQSIKSGLVRGLSIGFQSLEEAYDKTTGGFHFLKWLWLELSAVTIPANADATIATIKSLDVGLTAPGSAAADRARSTTAGVPASSRVVSMRTERHMKKSYADQIASWEATRAAKTARMDELLTKSGDAGVTLDDAEQEEHDTLAGEVDKIDAQLVRLRAAEAREKAAAAPVAGRNPREGAQARTGIITVERKLPPGIQFARYAMCIAASKGSRLEAIDLAKTQYPDDPAVLAMVEKAAVGATNTQTAGSGSELVPYNVMDDFIEYLRPRTILGKFGTNGIPALRRVPFNTRVSGASAGTTAYWVGEGLPVPLSKMTTITTSLSWAKIEALTVLTKEEVRFSNPSAESKVRDDIARAVIARMDIDFIDPGKAAVANVSPASITFNTLPLAPTGATAAAFRTDLATLMGTFATLMLDPSDIVLVMSTARALNLSLMITTLGNPVFPGLTMQGGNLLGFPVITSEAMVALGSPDEDIIVAVKAGDIYLADDGVVTVDASDQASLEMLDGSLQQNGLTGTGASLVSLWQSGLLGLKAMREVTWKLRRAGAARYIGPAAYAA